MKVQVTEKHIKLGKRRSCSQCPVALALKDVVVDQDVRVRGRYFYAGLWAQKQKRAPRSVSRFVKKFDSEKPVEPFVFMFDTSWL